jgi:hypothetical protein
MSLLSKAVHGITHAVGHAADQVAKPLGVKKTSFLNFIMPGAGGLASGIDKQRHGGTFWQGVRNDLGDTAKLGAMAYGAHALGGLGGSASAPAGGAGEAAGSSALDALPSTIPNVSTVGELGAAQGIAPISAEVSALNPGSVVSAARAGGSFLKNNALPVAMGLQAAGGLLNSGSENRLRNAEADKLEQQAGESRYDFEQRKRREAQLAPIWSALGTSVGRQPNVAPNPYVPQVA